MSNASDWMVIGGIGFILAILGGQPLWAIAWGTICIGGTVLSVHDAIERK